MLQDQVLFKQTKVYPLVSMRGKLCSVSFEFDPSKFLYKDKPVNLQYPFNRPLLKLMTQG
jgi:hypothetical protein